MMNSHLIPCCSRPKETTQGFPGREYITWTGTPRLSARETAAYTQHGMVRGRDLEVAERDVNV